MEWLFRKLGTFLIQTADDIKQLKKRMALYDLYHRLSIAQMTLEVSNLEVELEKSVKQRDDVLRKINKIKLAHPSNCACGHSLWSHSQDFKPDRYDDICHVGKCSCRKFHTKED